MIPYLKQKVWYAFQGLPIERIDSTDRLPWSKCLVLTNNIMHILQFSQLTESFKRCIKKSLAEDNKGVTFEEYLSFIDIYLEEQNINKPHLQQNTALPVSEAPTEVRMRGNNNESQASSTKSVIPVGPGKPESDLTPLIKTFDDYCWTLFRTKNIPHLNNQSSLHDGFFRLWLLFITYSITNSETGERDIPVRMDIFEAKYWCGRIREMLGARRAQFEDLEYEENVTSVEYKEFYSMFQDIFKDVSVADDVFEIALRELAEEALDGVTMKGAIKIDRYTRYCVLKSSILLIYNNKTGPVNLRSCFIISGYTELMAGTNKIIMKTPGLNSTTVLTIEISEVPLFNKWRAAISDAIEYAKLNITHAAIAEGKKREEARQSKRSAIKANRLLMQVKLDEEIEERSKLTQAMKLQLLLADRKLDDFREKMAKELLEKEILLKQNENIRQETEAHIKTVIGEQQTQYAMHLEKLKEIENERNILNEKLQVTMEEKSNEEMKRTQLEEKHITAQRMLLEAEKKISTLEKLSEQLEKALEEEKQAKEEEEAVRNATLALLEEEQRSKENLETLLRQQNSMINEEIQKRNEYAQELENEKYRIQSIADEKEKLAKQLEDTRIKMQVTGNRVRKLDTKVAQIAETMFGKEETRLPVSHRGKGFLAEIMVSTQLNKPRPEVSEANDKNDYSA